MARRLAAVAALAVGLTIGCGGGHSNTAPAPLPSPGPAPSPGASPSPSPSPSPSVTPSPSPTTSPVPSPSPDPTPTPTPAPTRTVRSGEVRCSAEVPSQPLAIAGDAGGNVFVMTEGATPSGDATRTRISKIGPDGRELWSVALPPGLWGSRSLAALSSGDIAVGACSVTYCFPPEGTPMTSVVLRLSTADGHEVWRAAMPAPSVGSLSADGAGRVVALSAGLPTSSAAGTPARVVLIGAGGDVLLDQATDIRLPLVALGGASGDFLVAGQDASDRPVYERRRSDGALVFREVLDTRHGFVNRIAFAQNGSIALGGSFQDFLQLRDRRFDLGYGSGFLVVASGDGTPQWALADSGLDGSSGVAPYLAFGRDNDVVTYTMTFGKGQANLRSYTRDGALKWRHDFGGIFGTWVNTVAVARNGDVVVGANGTADVPFRTLPYEKSTQFVAVIAP